MNNFENFLDAEVIKTYNKDYNYVQKSELRHDKKRKWEDNKAIRIISIMILSFIAVSFLIVFVYAKCNADPEPVHSEVTTEHNDEIVEVHYELVENDAYEVEATEPTPYYLQYDVPLDEETLRLISEACEVTGIRFELALSVIWKETRFKNSMGDGGASYGYMQVQPRWHKDRMERLGVTDLTDPYSNFLVGCDFLAELLAKYDLADALTYYNSGHTGCNQYARDVMNYMENLNLLTKQN